jgi:hypothetical protein
MNIFELMEELKISLKGDKETMERLLISLKPDILLTKSSDLKTLSMQYSVLKVTTRIARLGKDPGQVFELIDLDKSGSCK